MSEQLPRRIAIGLQADGSWATSQLKEYPPALCLALAQCFSTHAKEVPPAAQPADAANFLDRCKGLIVQNFSAHFWTGLRRVALTSRYRIQHVGRSESYSMPNEKK